MNKGFLNGLSQNIGFKIVAFVVALALWAMIQGRRDQVLTVFLPVEMLVRENMELLGPKLEKVQAKLSGPRLALRNFDSSKEVFSVDLTNRTQGKYRVELSHDNLELPLGVKLIEVTPDAVEIELQTKKEIE